MKPTPSPLADRRPGGGLPLEPPDADERRRARLALLLVAIGYVLVHVVVVGLERPIFWDEAIHFSQVARGRTAIFLEPHRTRGPSLLALPIGIFDPPMPVLRGYLAVLGGVGIFAAFSTWIRSIGSAAPLAALLFAAYRVTIYYGAEVLPNLPAALLCIAAAGLAARAAEQEELDRRTAVAIAAVFCLFALVRPPDAVLTGLGVAAALLVTRWRSATWAVPAAAIGGLLGLIPWFIEGAVRFGFDPLTLLRSGSDYGANAERINRLSLYLRFIEDRLRCSDACEAALIEEGSLWALPGWRSLLFILISLGLAVVALRAGGSRRAPLVAAVVSGGLILGFYAFTSIMNQRYILPAVAVWLIVPAVGGIVTWRWAGTVAGGDALRVAGWLLLALGVWWQAAAGVERLEAAPARREEAQAVGLAVAEVAAGEPCAVATTGARPMIQYWSGCEVVNLVDRDADAIQKPVGELDSYVDLRALRDAGHRVFAVSDGPVADDSPVASWQARHLTGDADGYVLYEHRLGDPLPPAPCPPPDGAVRLLGDVLSEGC